MFGRQKITLKKDGDKYVARYRPAINRGYRILSNPDSTEDRLEDPRKLLVEATLAMKAAHPKRRKVTVEVGDDFLGKTEVQKHNLDQVVTIFQRAAGECDIDSLTFKRVA